MPSDQRLCLDFSGSPGGELAGTVTTSSGEVQRFTGWIGLMQALRQAIEEPAR